MYSIILQSISISYPRVCYHEDGRTLGIFATTEGKYPIFLEVTPGVTARIPHGTLTVATGGKTEEDAVSAAKAFFGKSILYTRFSFDSEDKKRLTLTEPFLVVTHEEDSVTEDSTGEEVRETAPLAGSWNGLRYIYNPNIEYRNNSWHATPRVGDTVVIGHTAYQSDGKKWESADHVVLPTEFQSRLWLDLNTLTWHADLPAED